MSKEAVKIKKLKEKIEKLLDEKSISKEEMKIFNEMEKEVKRKEEYYSLSLTIPKREKFELSAEALKKAKELSKALNSVRSLNKVWA